MMTVRISIYITAVFLLSSATTLAQNPTANQHAVKYLRSMVPDGTGRPDVSCATVPSEPDFTVVMVPDVHVNEGPQYATAVGNWIAAHCSTWNCRAVMGVGDYDGLNSNNATKQANIEQGWNLIYSKVDALGLPWISAAGNHDYDDDSPSRRRTTLFDGSDVGYAKIGTKSFFGGYWTGDPNGGKANQWIKFDVGTLKFAALAAELFPRSAALAWATGVVAANTDRKFFYLSHSIENCTGWIAPGDPYGGNAYGLGSDSQGAAQRDAISANDNVFLAFNGHYIGCGSTGGHLNITWTGGINAHPVQFMRTDYQETNPSIVTLLKFRQASGVIEVYIYDTLNGREQPSWPMYTIPWTH